VRLALPLLLAAVTSCAAPIRHALPVEESTPIPGLFVTRRTFYYEVPGSSSRELRERMDRIGPLDGGARSAAYTQTLLHWQFEHERRGTLCAIRDARVDLQITYTLPEWVPYADAEPRLAPRWRSFSRALLVHEKGHDELGLEAALALTRALQGVPEQAFCDDVDRAVRALAEEAIRELTAKHAEYDRRTQRGATQGAVLP
jgi:predicted secreted Zn-dependent protease